MANQGNDIPLQTVVSHSPSASGEKDAEKSGMFSGRGRRQLAKIDSRTGAPLPPRVAAGQEKTALNKMGRFYTKVLNFSIVTRYMIYVAPVALLLAIPIILSQTGVIHGSIGNTQQRPFWIWIEISMPASHHALTLKDILTIRLVWLSFWAMKIVCHFLPNVFEFLIGVVSPGVKKYALLLRAVEKPLSFVLWMVVNQATFPGVSLIHGIRRKC